MTPSAVIFISGADRAACNRSTLRPRPGQPTRFPVAWIWPANNASIDGARSAKNNPTESPKCSPDASISRASDRFPKRLLTEPRTEALVVPALRVISTGLRVPTASCSMEPSIPSSVKDVPLSSPSSRTRPPPLDTGSRYSKSAIVRRWLYFSLRGRKFSSACVTETCSVITLKRPDSPVEAAGLKRQLGWPVSLLCRCRTGLSTRTSRIRTRPDSTAFMSSAMLTSPMLRKPAR